MGEKVLVEKCHAYREVLDRLIPGQVMPHRIKARKRALRECNYGKLNIAKYFALRLGADREQLAIAELLIFDDTLVARHPDPRRGYWKESKI